MKKDFYHKVIISPRICQIMSVFINVYAITLYPFIIARDRLSITTYNHEKIHLVQQRELWVIGFYLLYVLYWLKGRLKGLSSAGGYYAIPFEKEAYENENNLNYLKDREAHSWKNYIK